jgi:hypothetical protein
MLPGDGFVFRGLITTGLIPADDPMDEEAGLVAGLCARNRTF